MSVKSSSHDPWDNSEEPVDPPFDGGNGGNPGPGGPTFDHDVIPDSGTPCDPPANPPISIHELPDEFPLDEVEEA